MIFAFPRLRKGNHSKEKRRNENYVPRYTHITAFYNKKGPSVPTFLMLSPREILIPSLRRYWGQT